MGAGEVIVTIVAILVAGLLIFCLLVLLYGNRLPKQKMEDEICKECVKNREELIKKKAEEKKKQRELEKVSGKVAHVFEAVTEDDVKALDGYMEVFPELPKETQKKTTKRKSTKKKDTKKVTE